MKPNDEIGEAIEGAASSIAKAAEFIKQNALVQARKSLLLARIDLEFALGVTHLLRREDQDEDRIRERIRVKDSDIGSDTALESVNEWLEQVKHHLSRKDYAEAEVRLMVAIRFLESTMKSIEGRSQKGAARQPS